MRSLWAFCFAFFFSVNLLGQSNPASPAGSLGAYSAMANAPPAHDRPDPLEKFDEESRGDASLQELQRKIEVLKQKINALRHSIAFPPSTIGPANLLPGSRPRSGITPDNAAKLQRQKQAQNRKDLEQTEQDLAQAEAEYKKLHAEKYPPILVEPGPREWRDPGGKILFRAEIKALDASGARFLLDDGKTAKTLSMDRLARADRRYVLSATMPPAMRDLLERHRAGKSTELKLLQEGQVGFLLDDLSILRVVDGDNLLAAIENRDRPTVWVQGLATKGLADSDRLRPGLCFRVGQVKRYKTNSGWRSAHILEYLDLDLWSPDRYGI